MPKDDFDIVADLNEGTADVISANTGNVQVEGQDAVDVNAQVRGEQPAQPKIVDDAAKTDDKPKSVRDTISSALKADAEAATPQNAQQGDGRPRNPDGTFAEKPAVDPNAASVDPNAAPVGPNASAPKVAAPQGIDAQVFASLPAETQVSLARTMEDVEAQQRRFAVLAPIEQLVAPRFDAWAMNGMSPQVAIHQLLALSDFASKDTAGFIKYIAQANNVDLADIVLGMDDDEPVDPAIKAMQDRIAELEGSRTQEQQQRQQAIHNETVNQVLAFAEEKDAGGQPLRPYLEELGQAWLPYIGVVKAQNPTWPHSQVLQQAYENACWANASVRGKMQEAANAAAEAERLRKEAARTDAARAASATVRTGAPAAPPVAPNDPNRSTRDVIRAAMAQHS
jgi:hypothetical protein